MEPYSRPGINDHGELHGRQSITSSFAVHWTDLAQRAWSKTVESANAERTLRLDFEISGVLRGSQAKPESPPYIAVQRK